MNVAILTDSTSDLSPDQAAGAGITVVPLYVRFGADEYRAGVDLTTERFWETMLAPGAAHPTTAAPSPGDFRTAFEAALAAGADAHRVPHHRPQALGDVPVRNPGRGRPARSRDPRHRHRVHLDVHRDPGAPGGRPRPHRPAGRADRR